MENDSGSTGDGSHLLLDGPSNDIQNEFNRFWGGGTVRRASTSLVSEDTMQNFSVPLERAGGNVHTGAPPPWFEANEENQLNVQSKPISFSLPNKSGKKLNAKSVGAVWAERKKLELEMEKRGEITKSDFDANWLPDFG